MRYQRRITMGTLNFDGQAYYTAAPGYSMGQSALMVEVEASIRQTIGGKPQ